MACKSSEVMAANQTPVLLNGVSIRRLAGLSEASTGLSGLFSYPAHGLPDLAFLTSGAWGSPPPLPPLEALQVEYTRLFINTLPEVPCPPYGSLYLEGVCMAASTVSIQAIYRRAGIESREMPDDLAVELEFLGMMLSRLSVEAVGSCADVAEIIQHLSDWTPMFFERVEQHDRTNFYRFAAGVGRGVIRALSEAVAAG